MSPRNKILQSIYLEQAQTDQLSELAEKSGLTKAVLLREAVDDLLARNRMGTESRRITLVREALKKARGELEKYGRDIEQRKAGLVPYRSCLDAIHRLDLAREELGD